MPVRRGGLAADPKLDIRLYAFIYVLRCLGSEGKLGPVCECLIRRARLD
jgi:hypothetical protein